MFPNSKHLVKESLKGILQSSKLPFRIIWKGRSKEKKLALTFDDGPDPNHTPRILDVLSQLGLVATFFLLGDKAQKQRGLVKKIADQGHEIGNHSFDHNRFRAKPFYNFNFQIDKTNQILASIVGTYPAIFRPPYGIVSVPLLLYCAKKKITIVMWSVDSMDSFSSRLRSEPYSIRNAGNNDILLMHDDSATCLSILFNEIPILIDKGFSFVDVSSMLNK